MDPGLDVPKNRGVFVWKALLGWLSPWFIHTWLFPLKFPASLRCTECSLNHLGVLFFFTKEIGDAQVWVPKSERLWVPQIKQGVSGQSPWGLWGPTSSSTLGAASLASTLSPPWPFPLSLHSPIRREGCPQGAVISHPLLSTLLGLKVSGGICRAPPPPPIQRWRMKPRNLHF